MKKFRITFLLPLLILGLFLSACTGQSTAIWPGLETTPSTSYVAFGDGVFAVNNTSGALVWRFPDKAQSGKNFYAPPALTSDGNIVVGDFSNTLYELNQNGQQVWAFDKAKEGYLAGILATKDGIYAPNNDNSLYALTLQGALRWTFTTKAALWAQPVSDGETIYLGGMDHMLYALQASDGSKKWATNVGGAINNGPILSQDGVLYVGTLGSEVLAIKASNGTVLWRTPTDAGVWCKLALNNGNLVFGDISGKIYALNAADGKVIWTVPNQGGLITGGAAVLPDGYVLATENSKVIKVDPNGKILWNQTISGKLYTMPAYTGNNILVAEMSGDALMVSLDQSGKQVWSFVAPK